MQRNSFIGLIPKTGVKYIIPIYCGSEQWEIVNSYPEQVDIIPGPKDRKAWPEEMKFEPSIVTYEQLRNWGAFYEMEVEA